MKKNLPNLSYKGLVNVIDLEALTKGKKEIAEFGITVVSLKERKIISNYSLYVRPNNISSDYDQFFYNLTKIKKSTLYKAVPLKERMEDLANSINIIKRPFICWGEDHVSLSQELWSKRCPKLQPMHVLNLQLLYSFQTGRTDNISLKQALEEFKIPFEGSPHSGKADSYNTAKLLLKLIE